MTDKCFDSDQKSISTPNREVSHANDNRKKKKKKGVKLTKNSKHYTIKQQLYKLIIVNENCMIYLMIIIIQTHIQSNKKAIFILKIYFY